MRIADSSNADSAASRPQSTGHVAWGVILSGTLLTGGAIALIWMLAVPVGPVVCPAVHPAPRNCFASDRAGTALIVSFAIGLIYIATMIFATKQQVRRHSAVGLVGVALLAIAPIVGYLIVAWIPGFALT